MVVWWGADVALLLVIAKFSPKALQSQKRERRRKNSDVEPLLNAYYIPSHGYTKQDAKNKGIER